MRWLVLIASAVLLFFAQAEVGGVAGRLNTSSVDLETALTTAIQPLLQNLSSRYNSSAWGFAYRDADINVAFCAGYSNVRLPFGPLHAARICTGLTLYM